MFILVPDTFGGARLQRLLGLPCNRASCRPSARCRTWSKLHVETSGFVPTQILDLCAPSGTGCISGDSIHETRPKQIRNPKPFKALPGSLNWEISLPVRWSDRRCTYTALLQINDIASMNHPVDLVIVSWHLAGNWDVSGWGTIWHFYNCVTMIGQIFLVTKHELNTYKILFAKQIVPQPNQYFNLALPHAVHFLLFVKWFQTSYSQCMI